MPAHHATSCSVSVLSLALLLGAPVVARADTVYLKNGNWIDGLVRREHNGMLEVEIGTVGLLQIPVDTVERVDRNVRRGRDQATRIAEVKRPGEDGGSPGGGASDDETPRAGDAESAAEVSGEEETGSAGESDDAAGEDDAEPAAPGGGAPLPPELESEIEALIHELQRQRPRNRVRAERRLKAVGAPAVPFLLPLATHASSQVRVAVFRLFHHFGDERVIEAAVQALSDADEFVRDYANRTLERVTGERMGFQPLAGREHRQRAASRWRAWWERERKVLEGLERQAARR